MPGQGLLTNGNINGNADAEGGGAYLLAPLESASTSFDPPLQLCRRACKTSASKVILSMGAALLFAFLIVSCTIAIRTLSSRSASLRRLAHWRRPCRGGRRETDAEVGGEVETSTGSSASSRGTRGESCVSSAASEHTGEDGKIQSQENADVGNLDQGMLMLGDHPGSATTERERRRGGGLVRLFGGLNIIVPSSTPLAEPGEPRQAQLKELVRNSLQLSYGLTVRSDCPRGNALRRLRYLRRSLNNIMNIFATLDYDESDTILSDSAFVERSLATLRAISCQLYSWQSMVTVYEEVLLPRLLRTFLRLNNIRDHIFNNKCRTLFKLKKHNLQLYVDELSTQHAYAVQLTEGAKQMEEIKEKLLDSSEVANPDHIHALEQDLGMRLLLYKALLQPSTLTDALECCVDLCIAMAKRGEGLLLGKTMIPVLRLLAEEQIMTARVNSRLSSPTYVAAALATVGRIQSVLQNTSPQALPFTTVLFTAIKHPVLETSLGEKQLQRLLEDSSRATRIVTSIVNLLTSWAKGRRLPRHFLRLIEELEAFELKRGQERRAMLHEYGISLHVGKPTRKACVLWNRMQRRYIRTQAVCLKTLAMEKVMAHAKFGAAWDPTVEMESREAGAGGGDDPSEEMDPVDAQQEEEALLSASSLFQPNPVWDASKEDIENAVRQGYWAKSAKFYSRSGVEKPQNSILEKARATPWGAHLRFQKLVLPFERVPTAWTEDREELHREAIFAQERVLENINDEIGPFPSVKERHAWLHAEVQRILMPLGSEEQQEALQKMDDDRVLLSEDEEESKPQKTVSVSPTSVSIVTGQKVEPVVRSRPVGFVEKFVKEDKSERSSELAAWPETSQSSLLMKEESLKRTPGCRESPSSSRGHLSRAFSWSVQGPRISTNKSSKDSSGLMTGRGVAPLYGSETAVPSLGGAALLPTFVPFSTTSPTGTFGFEDRHSAVPAVTPPVLTAASAQWKDGSSGQSWTPQLHAISQGANAHFPLLPAAFPPSLFTPPLSHYAQPRILPPFAAAIPGGSGDVGESIFNNQIHSPSGQEGRLRTGGAAPGVRPGEEKSAALSSTSFAAYPREDSSAARLEASEGPSGEEEQGMTGEGGTFIEESLSFALTQLALRGVRNP